MHKTESRIIQSQISKKLNAVVVKKELIQKDRITTGGKLPAKINTAGRYFVIELKKSIT